MAWLPAASADIFQFHLDAMIRDHGGGGSAGSVTLHLDGAIDQVVLAGAWARLQRRCPLLAAVPSTRRGRPGWMVGRGHSASPLQGRLGLGDLGQRRVLLGCVEGEVTLLFDHRLCDERAAEDVLAALGRLADGRAAELSWATPADREISGLPRAWLQRAQAMRTLRGTLRPLRLAPAWRPAHTHAAAPMLWHDRILGGEILARIEANQTAEVGRLGRCAFLMAAVARALDLQGAAGQPVVFALALDDRPRGDGALLANRHALALLALAGAERGDRRSAAQAAQTALRTWVRSGADRAMAAALHVSPWLGRRCVRAQLGGFAGGVDATCLLSHVGKTRIPQLWLARQLLGVTRRVAIPHSPGLVVLSGEDPRGWGLSVGMTEGVARAMAPAVLAEAITAELAHAP